MTYCGFLSEYQKWFQNKLYPHRLIEGLLKFPIIYLTEIVIRLIGLKQFF